MVPNLGKTILKIEKSNSNASKEGLPIGRNRVRLHMRHINLIHTGGKGYSKKDPITLVVSRSNIM